MSDKKPFKGLNRPPKVIDKNADLEEADEFEIKKQSKVAKILDKVADRIDHVMHPDHRPHQARSDIQNHPKFDKFKKGKS